MRSAHLWRGTCDDRREKWSQTCSQCKLISVWGQIWATFDLIIHSFHLLHFPLDRFFHPVSCMEEIFGNLSLVSVFVLLSALWYLPVCTLCPSSTVFKGLSLLQCCLLNSSLFTSIDQKTCFQPFSFLWLYEQQECLLSLWGAGT